MLLCLASVHRRPISNLRALHQPPGVNACWPSEIISRHQAQAVKCLPQEQVFDNLYRRLSCSVSITYRYTSCCVCHTGRYPAIDRLLARKQAISKLQCLKRPPIGSAASTAFDKSTQPHDALSVPDPYHLASDKASTTHPDLASAESLFSQVTCSSPDDEQQLICSQFGHSGELGISDVAHSQYTQFRYWRQQRHDAAVTVQTYLRRFLAQQLILQLRQLRVHAQKRRRRTLMNCLHAWQKRACSQADFRYGCQIEGITIHHYCALCWPALIPQPISCHTLMQIKSA